MLSSIDCLINKTKTYFLLPFFFSSQEEMSTNESEQQIDQQREKKQRDKRTKLKGKREKGKEQSTESKKGKPLAMKR